jgi:WbqC-like protein family
MSEQSAGVDIVGIHQPSYLPWFGLVDKVARCNRFVVLDNVQYNARAFQHRTLYSATGGSKYLSLSVNSKGHQNETRPLGEMRLIDQDLPAKHYLTLRHRYGKRKGWGLIGPMLEAIMCRPHKSLLELNVALLELTLRQFAIATPCILASLLPAQGVKSQLILELTRAAGGRAYLSGQGARDYMDDALFMAAGIGVVYQEFVHPVFEQSQTSEFQKGCFALEWLIEEPDAAVARFHDHLHASGAPPPCSLGARVTSHGPQRTTAIAPVLRV